LTKFERWLHSENDEEEEHCVEGVGSMFAAHMLATDTGIKRMKEVFTDFTGRSPAVDGTKLMLKPFAKGQDVKEMGGNVFKDMGLPHFQNVIKGTSESS